VIVVSHDRYFLDRICDRIVAFEENGVFVQPGNYSYYLEKRKQREAARPRVAPVPPFKAAVKEGSPAVPAANRKLSFNEQREFNGMESAILAAETLVQELETLLNDPEFHATRSREAHEMLAKLETARAEVTRLYERWHDLGTRIPNKP
jgi:ATP-binding cassette subfamily F protein uup